MNNYKFYEKEIIEILESGKTIAVINGIPKACDDVNCEKCDVSGACNRGLGEWLAKEHINTVGCNKRTDGAVEFCTWLLTHYRLKPWIFKVEKALLKYMKEKGEE